MYDRIQYTVIEETFYVTVAVFDDETVHNLKWNTAVYTTVLKIINSNNSPYYAHPRRNTTQGSLVSVSASFCKEKHFLHHCFCSRGGRDGSTIVPNNLT
jgi:hypothetical protein